MNDKRQQLTEKVKDGILLVIVGGIFAYLLFWMWQTDNTRRLEREEALACARASSGTDLEIAKCFWKAGLKTPKGI